MSVEEILVLCGGGMLLTVVVGVYLMFRHLKQHDKVIEINQKAFDYAFKALEQVKTEDDINDVITEFNRMLIVKDQYKIMGAFRIECNKLVGMVQGLRMGLRIKTNKK